MLAGAARRVASWHGGLANRCLFVCVSGLEEELPIRQREVAPPSCAFSSPKTRTKRLRNPMRFWLKKRVPFLVWNFRNVVL